MQTKINEEDKKLIANISLDVAHIHIIKKLISKEIEKHEHMKMYELYITNLKKVYDVFNNLKPFFVAENDR